MFAEDPEDPEMPDPEEPGDKYYWPKFVVASILIATGTAVAQECARVLADALRKRWDLAPEDKDKDREGDKKDRT